MEQEAAQVLKEADQAEKEVQAEMQKRYNAAQETVKEEALKQQQILLFPINSLLNKSCQN